MMDDLRSRLETKDATIKALETEVKRLSSLTLVTECMAARRERDEVLADNAALLAHARFLYVEAPPIDACATDVMMDRWDRAKETHVALMREPHPGTALLEEHRKALVRARNEGLEKAATECDRLLPETTIFPATRSIVRAAARNIRAMKQPEQL